MEVKNNTDVKALEGIKTIIEVALEEAKKSNLKTLSYLLTMSLYEVDENIQESENQI